LIKKFPSVWEKCQKTAEGGGVDSHCRGLAPANQKQLEMTSVEGIYRQWPFRWEGVEWWWC